jgi:hypothetical protein
MIFRFWIFNLICIFMSAKLLIPQETLIHYKSRDPIPLECEFCNRSFNISKNEVCRWLKGSRTINCCSLKCMGLLNTKKKTIQCLCKQCNKNIIKYLKEYNTSKSKFLFCSKSCAAIYNSAHKTHGYQRSKLELWIESQLNILYPSIKILYNDRKTINAELDIYIPSLKLAFELNGIFHYEPIYGNNRLQQMKTNDHRKFQACTEHKIELCIIDTYNVKYLKKERDQKFLNIILDIINAKLNC